MAVPSKAPVERIAQVCVESSRPAEENLFAGRYAVAESLGAHGAHQFCPAGVFEHIAGGSGGYRSQEIVHVIV